MRWQPSALAVLVAWGGSVACVAEPSISAAGDSFLRYTGTASADRTQAFIYRETHILHYRDGKLAERVVLYGCRDGAPFARKTSSYADPLLPDFLLEDTSNGMRQGVRSEAGKREVFFRPDQATPEKHSELPHAPGAVADTGFDAFIRANWQALLSGQSVTMNFLVPSRLEEMGFKVQHVRNDVAAGTPVEVFRLKLSGVLGWVAPSIDVYYSTGDRVLVRFVGVSDLRDASQNNYPATIDFPPAERAPTDAAALSDARAARLAPCH